MAIYRNAAFLTVERVMAWGAALFAAVSISNTLFLPPGFEIPGDNLLFLPAFAYMLLTALREHSFRPAVIAFFLLYAWMLATTALNHRLNADTLLMSTQLLRWPVILAIAIYPGPLRFDMKRSEKLIDMTFMLLVGINLFLLINPAGMGEMLQNLYSPKAFTNFTYYNEPGMFRLSGTFTNPNDNGLVFGMFSIYYLLRRPLQFWYFPLMGIILILMTQSRTCLLGMGIPLLVLLLSRLKIHRSRKLVFALPVLALLLVAVMYFSTNLRSIITGRAFSSHSFQVRYENFNLFFAEEINKWTGMGVIQDVKATFGLYIDSEVAAILLQSGVIGFGLWLLVFAMLFRMADKTHRMAVFTALAFLFVCSFTNYTLLNHFTSLALAFVLALAARNDRTMIPQKIPSTA